MRAASLTSMIVMLLLPQVGRAESTHRYEIVSDLNSWKAQDLGVYGGNFFEAPTNGSDSLILVDLNGDKLAHGDFVYIYSDTYDVFAQIRDFADGSAISTASRIVASRGTFIVERDSGPGTVEHGDFVKLASFSEFTIGTSPGQPPLPFS